MAAELRAVRPTHLSSHFLLYPLLTLALTRQSTQGEFGRSHAFPPLLLLTWLFTSSGQSGKVTAR